MEMCLLLLLFETARFLQVSSGQEFCGNLRWNSTCPTEELLHKIQVEKKALLNSRVKAAMIDLDNVRNTHKQIQTSAESYRKRKKELADIIRLSKKTDTAISNVDIASTATLNKELHAAIKAANVECLSLDYSCKSRAYREKFARGDKRIPVLTGRDCAEIHSKGGRKNGFYFIHPMGSNRLIKVYCDMKDRGGGWTVIQRRYNGQVDFDRNWEDYKWGFGQKENNKNWEYWIGNEYIHMLTRQNLTELKIDLLSWDGMDRFAIYRYFAVDDEMNEYKLKAIDGYLVDPAGNVGDALGTNERSVCSNNTTPNIVAAGHRGEEFTTKDHDNDRTQGNCADHGRGGWWYSDCFSANLNGIRKRTTQQLPIGIAKVSDGIIWNTWRGCHESLKASTMKVRPLAFRPDQNPILPDRQEIARRRKMNDMKIIRRLSRRWRRSSARRRKQRRILRYHRI